MQHIPVLLDELVTAVKTDGAGQYVDGTFGRGGHCVALLDRLKPSARLLAIDRDPAALAAAGKLAAEDPRVTVAAGRFSEIDRLASSHGFDAVVGIMLDIGVSSPQLEEPERGFSFLQDGPLDMRMDNGAGRTAAQWLDAASEDEIAGALRRYGEERFARQIAKAIVDARPIETTLALAEIVSGVVPARPAKQRRDGAARHPATRAFQALRIVVNDELEELDRGLDAALSTLVSGGRLGVVTFHSLEHGMVRRRFREWVRGRQLPRRLPVTGVPLSRASYVVKQARPSDLEAERNPRARSAMLQVVEKAA